METHLFMPLWGRVITVLVDSKIAEKGGKKTRRRG